MFVKELSRPDQREDGRDRSGILDDLWGRTGCSRAAVQGDEVRPGLQRDFKVGFWRTAALVNHLSQLNDRCDLHGFLKTLEKLDLLICDEWGYVPVSRDGAQLLFQVVSACYEKRSMAITTNLEFGRWVNIFLDQTMTTALIDRLVHHSHLLIFDGESHRVKNSLMRR